MAVRSQPDPEKQLMIMMRHTILQCPIFDGMCLNDRDTMMDSVIPVVKEYLRKTIWERSQEVCHDSHPIATAVHIVIYKCFVPQVRGGGMLPFLRMKYTTLTGENLNETERMIGDYDDYLNAKEISIDDKMKEVMDLVYLSNDYLLIKDIDYKYKWENYIKPFTYIFSRLQSNTKNSNKT